jgi:hypothetical protein
MITIDKLRVLFFFFWLFGFLAFSINKNQKKPPKTLYLAEGRGEGNK